MVLDMGYCIREWVPPSSLPQSSAYLLLPGAFSGLGDRVIANAYAALKELNYYSRNDTRFESQYSSSPADRIGDQSSRDTPFNFCYLVGNSNDKVTFSSLGDVLEMVAQNIFLDFSSGFSQYKKLVRDNIRKHWSSPDPLGYPQNFISFGLSSIQFPVERVLNACAYRLAKEVVQWWSNPTPAPSAMRDTIKTEILPGMKLAESADLHQMLDSISLGDNSKPYAKEISDWVAFLRKRRNDLNIPFENLQRFVSVEQSKFDPHFNDSDSDPRRWSDYYQRMWDNLQTLIPQKRGELRQAVANMVEDRYRGPKFAFQFLEVLTEILSEYRSDFDQKRQKDWLPRERSAANALQTLLKQIDDHAKQFMLLNRKKTIDEDFDGIANSLETLYTAKIEVKVRQLGVQLVDSLKEEIEQLRLNLTAFNDGLRETEAYFADKEATYERETGTLSVNGILLYDPKDIRSVYTATLGDRSELVYQGASQDVLAALGVKLFDLYTFDVLRRKDCRDRLFNRCLDEFVGSPHLQISAARKFLEQYPTLEAQEAQIKTTFEKSEPFVRFSQEQMRLGWEDRLEKRQKLVGLQGGSKPTDPAVASLLPIVRKTSTLTDKDIRPLNDPHHVFFVHEIGAFPLRLIEGMERMRTVYRVVSQADKNPLHTHLQERQFADIMPPSLAEQQVQNNLVLAQALDLVQLETNRATGYDEVRFAYRDRVTGLEKVESLGSTWEDALDVLLDDTNRRVRDLLGDAVQAVGRKCSTKADKQSLYQRLIQYLQQQERDLPAGKDNPQYAAIQTAIEDYFKTHGLTVEVVSAPVTAPLSTSHSNVSAPPPSPVSTPPSPTPPSPTTAATGTASAENLGKFEKLVQTCYKRGQPSTTELQLLETFRQKYGIAPELAEQIQAKYQSEPLQDAVYEYGLMFKAFLENDREIDLEEQAHLLELQEQLGLTNEQVTQIETNIREELGL
jgi:hypothetical protein